jgi:hypothetical protein
MKLNIKPLSERMNKVFIERDHIAVDTKPQNETPLFKEVIINTVDRIKAARKAGASVVLAFGAHSIKNCTGPILIKLMEDGWVTHLATNGAGIIHDWEFAYLGESSEDVRANVDRGEFGIWEETGKFINLALVIGAYEGKGYGEAVGSMIEKEGLTIPSEDDIEKAIKDFKNNPAKAAGAIDAMEQIKKFNLSAGWMSIPHPFKQYCVQAAAYRLGVPFTGHPMFGHDIIYTHPMNHGAAIGRAAERDFLRYANSIDNLENGVYLSIGSAVMSPMIFEKSLSMSQNLHIQNGEHMDNHYMLIVDLAKSSWDWQKNGEPPETDPAYYLRYLKTFNRMGGTMNYLSADNRDFLLAISQELSK